MQGRKMQGNVREYESLLWRETNIEILSEEAVIGNASTKPKKIEGVDNGEEENSKIIMDNN